MEKSYSLLVLLGIGLLVNTCTKDDSKLTSDEALSDEQAEFCDNQASVELSSDEVLLPNGLTLRDFLLEMDPGFYNQWDKKSTSKSNDLGPQDSKNLLIAKLNAVALYLTDRTKFVYEGNDSGQPAQNGLAYSFGQKDYKIRANPPYGSCQDAEVYGLDCSGFIYQLFVQSNVIGMWSNAEGQRNPATIESAIKKAYPELIKIKVEDLGKIESSKFESGDIIYWLNSKGAYHIGMILRNVTGALLIAQSNGSKDTDCETNYGPNRGPRFFNVIPALQAPKKGLGTEYGIVRINTEISGKWDFILRCQNTDFTFLTLSLDFPTKNANEFVINKSAVYQSTQDSYDLVFTFTYNNVTNVLSCTFKTTSGAHPTFYRNDSFSVKLERDDTGYIPATLGDNRESGCTYDVKLVNKEVSAVKSALLSGMK